MEQRKNTDFAAAPAGAGAGVSAVPGVGAVPVAAGTIPLVASKAIAPGDYDNRVIRGSIDARRQVLAPASSTVIEDVKLDEHARLEKERDIANARAARRKMAASSSATDSLKSPQTAPSPVTAPTTPAPATRSTTPMMDEIGFVPNLDGVSGHHSIPRRIAAPASASGMPTNRRTGSSQDLRSLPGALHTVSPIAPDSPQSLAPPNGRFGNRGREASSSQVLSPSHSGSMIDMHLGFEDQQEHRMAQNGFVPGTPLRVDSPSAINRAFYGFPGDTEAEHVEPEEEEHIEGYSDPQAPDLAGAKKKKKGLRGLFSRISSTGRDPLKDDSNSKRSISSGSPKPRAPSLGADESMDLAPPPGLSGLINRARRSTSSLRSLLEREGGAGRAPSPGPAQMFNNNTAMGSQLSFGDPGPFGAMSSPLPPPRKESRGVAPGKGRPPDHVADKNSYRAPSR